MTKASLALVSLAALSACSGASGSAPRRTNSADTGVSSVVPPIEADSATVRASAARQASLAPDASDTQWTIPAKNYASTRYSGLDQITAANVGRLQVAFTFSTGIARGQEAAPLVVGGTMYIVTPFPNTLYALDLTRPGAPLKWKFRPTPTLAAQGVACCDVVNRGAAYWEGRIYFNTLDAHTVAVDAETGEEVWNTRAGRYQSGREHDHGAAGGEGEGAGGKQRWRVRRARLAHGPRRANRQDRLARVHHRARTATCSSGPASSRSIRRIADPTWASRAGRATRGSAAAAAPGGGSATTRSSTSSTMGRRTRGRGMPRCGRATTSGPPGSSPATRTRAKRYGPTSGARTIYTTTTASTSSSCSTSRFGARPRKTLVRPDRNGYIYVLDRETGEVLSADPFAYITTTKGVDLKSGRPIENPEKAPVTGKVVREICPAAPGAQGLAAELVVAAHGTALHAAPEPVPG